MVSNTFEPSPHRPPVRARAFGLSKCNMGAATSHRALLRALLFVAIALVLPRSAVAQSDAASFLAGAATALGAHEGGHLIADVAFGTSPGLKKVSFAGIPFFAITHDPVSPRREFVISSAGFWVQEATDEFVLSHRPKLRDHHAPFLKGALAFNLLTSMAYAGAAFARTGPIERDTHGMAAGANVPEPLIGALVLAPSVFDAWRYYVPDARWAKWSSRGAKIASVLLLVRTGAR